MPSISINQLKNNIKASKYDTNQLKCMLGSWVKCKVQQESTKWDEKIALVEQELQKLQDVTKEKDKSLPSDDKYSTMSIDERVARKFIQLKGSADRRGKEFNLTLFDVKCLLKRKTCYFTGVKLEVEGKYQRTIDRLDNTKGYVKGNVVPCTHWANQMKNELFELPDPMIKQMKRLISKVEGL